MGTPEPEYSDHDCDLCYPAGKTPFALSVAATGIMTGDTWAHGMPGPPNGTFTIYQIDNFSCYWGVLVGGVSILYQAPGAPGVMRIALQPPGLTAFQQAGDPCQKFFENNIVNPVGKPYYGGECQIWTP